MIIKDVIALAKHSELASLAIKENTEAIVAFLNLGMLELHKRFPIKVEEHVVDLEDGVVYYDMPTNFMYPLEAYGEVGRDSSEENQIPINDADDFESIFFPDWNTVQVPLASTGSYISIIYVAKPVHVTEAAAEDGASTLDLPDSLVDCLLSYIGYRGHLGVRSDAQSENSAHWSRFERSCKKARELGVACPADSMSMSERITTRGYA